MALCAALLPFAGLALLWLPAVGVVSITVGRHYRHRQAKGPASIPTTVEGPR